MATADDVARTMITLSKKEGATKASVLKGLHAEYPSVNARQMGKLVQQAYAKIARVQPK